MENITETYNFLMLEAITKVVNKLKPSNTRYDCISFAGEIGGGLKPFTNKLGMLFLSVKENTHKYNSDMPKRSLTGQELNFTGLLPTDYDNIFTGYPNGKEKLKNGKLNPTYEYRNDFYLIHFVDNWKSFQLLVFRNSKHQASEILDKYINGGYISQLKELNVHSKVYYHYDGMSLEKNL